MVVCTFLPYTIIQNKGYSANYIETIVCAEHIQNYGLYILDL